jgi:hypothetical protein
MVIVVLVWGAKVSLRIEWRIKTLMLFRPSNPGEWQWLVLARSTGNALAILYPFHQMT